MYSYICHSTVYVILIKTVLIPGIGLFGSSQFQRTITHMYIKSTTSALCIQCVHFIFDEIFDLQLFSGPIFNILYNCPADFTASFKK